MTRPLGVHYTQSPAGPYNGSQTTTVIVTATLTFGYEWGQMPAGWVKTNATTATYTVTCGGRVRVHPGHPTVTRRAVLRVSEAVVGVANDRRHHVHGVSGTCTVNSRFSWFGATVCACLQPLGL